MSSRELPDGWRAVKLGDACKIVMGQSPPGKSYNSEGVGVPLLNGPTEFGDEYPTAVQWTTDPKRFAEPDDILFCVRGATTGRKNLADQRYCIGRGLAAISAKGGQASNEFIYYALDFVTAGILREAAGSTFLNLPGRKLKNFIVPLPPLSEQHRIAAIIEEQMGAIEGARSAAEAQLVATEALIAANLREVFESEEASQWDYHAIGDIAQTSSGSTPRRGREEYYAGGTIPWVKTGELTDNVIYDTEEYVTELALDDTSLALLPVGTLLIAMYGQGQTRGRTALLGVEATTNQACFAVWPNLELFDTSFLQLWFRYSYKRLRQESEGRGGNQPNLSGKVLKKEKVPLPPVTVQRELSSTFEEYQESTDIAQVALNQQLALINNLPATILRKAFNGEL